MASVYRNNTSPFWWLKWRNPITDLVERFSTRCRIGTAAGRARAIQMRDEHSVKETAKTSSILNHRFAEWVKDYLDVTHAAVPNTLTRYQGRWRLLSSYLATHNIVAPAQIRREHCLGYVAWRKNVPHLNGEKPVCRNTILDELKFLSKILNEALTRNYIPFNPCARLKLRREPVRVRDELTDAHIKIISDALDEKKRHAAKPAEHRNADYLLTSFRIARLQGIRLSETYIRLDAFDLDRDSVFVKGKGGKHQEITLNPALKPFIRELRERRLTHTYQLPTRRQPSTLWFELFDKLRGRHPEFRDFNISFHSTRVTVISRLERAGASVDVTMKNVLHSSTTVHRIYRRVKPSELSPYWAALSSSSDKPVSS